MPVTSMLLNLVNTIPLSSFLTAWKYVIPLTMLFFLGILSCFQCSSLSWLTHLHQSSHSLSSSILLIHTLQSTPIPSIVARLINGKLSSTLIFPTVYLTSPFVCFRSSSKQISHTDLIISFPSIFQKLEVILDVLLSCLTISKQSSLVPEASHSYPSSFVTLTEVNLISWLTYGKSFLVDLRHRLLLSIIHSLFSSQKM